MTFSGLPGAKPGNGQQEMFIATVIAEVSHKAESN